MTLLLFLIPYSAPSITWLCVCRIIIQIAANGINANPLILDYVKKESRGRAVSMIFIGILLGEAFAVAILLEYSKYLEMTRAF